MSLFASIKKVATKTLDTVAGVFQNPITAVTKGPAAATQKFQNDNLTSRITKTVVTTVGAAAALIGGAAAASAGVAATAKTAVSAIVKNPIKSGAAFVAAPLIIKSEKAQQTIEDLPAAVANVGGDVGKVIDNPNISSITNLVKEHPVAATVTTLAAGLVVAKAASPLLTAYTNYSNVQATQENTQALLQPSNAPQTTSGYGIMPITAPSIAPIAEVAAPLGVAPSASSSIKAKKKAKKKAAKKKKTIKRKVTKK